MRGRSSARDLVGALASPRDGSRASSDDEFQLQSVLLLVYVSCCVIVLALLPFGGPIKWREAIPALMMQLMVAILLARARSLDGKLFSYIGALGIVVYLFSVALLRDSAGPTAGFGPLVLLPVLWAALNDRPRELLLAIVGVAAVYFAPTLLVGPPEYPAGAWQGGLLFVVLAIAAGLTVMHLRDRVGMLVRRLERLARTDELTGLPNRRAWQELLDREISAARRTGDPLVVVVLDLDHFKQFNDLNGHLAGDRLLIRAASAWRTVVRETDVLARWGGDEFGLLLPHCDSQQAPGLIDRLRHACPDVTFSAGYAEWDHQSSAQATVAAADAILYAAKHAAHAAVH